MGLMPEWKGFAALAVGYLGMPADTMPLYSDTPKYRRKADRICRLVLQTGNMGHNIDQSYRSKYTGFVAKVITFFPPVWRICSFDGNLSGECHGFWGCLCFPENKG
jgi:hypothetical protein